MRNYSRNDIKNEIIWNNSRNDIKKDNPRNNKAFKIENNPEEKSDNKKNNENNNNNQEPNNNQIMLKILYIFHFLNINTIIININYLLIYL